MPTLIKLFSSTHNTRIERLWVEVGSQFARRWRAFFTHLEHIHCLKRKNPHHLWLIHHLFLGAEESPHDKRFLGMIQHGIYTDDCEGLDITTIEESYGTAGPVVVHPPGHTGAGHLNDEDNGTTSVDSSDSKSDGSDDDLDLEGFDTDHQFLPKPMAIFDETLQLAVEAEILPIGYGICPEEWEDNHYPSVEIIQTGRKGAKELSVQLPDFVWRPRAHLWTLGLSVMEQIIENRNL
ncbi:hypothetical protein BT96DRAFT_960656 [Gymnopus androsaceus JB14]|uniref:Integrase core domain-containing protein n=1 Tax=Gymnopus androsaceus JB14 TaxID=1447944 RepID=A0A6A4GL23_9AGAR|nr:hypothetical protein BT96DRAFT_960656 [Gymnopus androsaceus JB14]